MFKANTKKSNAGKRRIILAAAVLVVIAAAVAALYILGVIARPSYTAEHFGIATVRSETDYNANEIDDYSDFVLGARKDAANHPKYDGSYYAGGYPPEDIGVCTDVVWRAFRQAGYCLRDMVNEDIIAHPENYTNITIRDKNIDFRRVRNLRVFFDRYALRLTDGLEDASDWQPGDIVIFGDDEHIGIVSDKRNSQGLPFILHNGGQPIREEDCLGKTDMQITGHYRFDAAGIDAAVLIPWTD